MGFRSSEPVDKRIADGLIERLSSFYGCGQSRLFWIPSGDEDAATKDHECPKWRKDRRLYFDGIGAPVGQLETAVVLERTDYPQRHLRVSCKSRRRPR